MKVYKLSYPDQLLDHHEEAYALAIGFFDGLHKGHQEVIETAIEKAKEKNIKSAVMTFDRHPSHVLGGGKNKVNYITPFEEKVKVIESLGADVLFVVEFDKQLASLAPEKFVDIFIKALGVRHVVAGFDYSFGSKGSGTMEDMARLADGLYETTVVGKVSDCQDAISSTRIRELLAKGKVEEAAKLLGRSFKTIGEVVHGEKNGRKLGFPTANVLPPSYSMLPLNGVYAVRFLVEGKQYNGVCNVGVKPTFDKKYEQATVEVHVLDFDGDLYDKHVIVEWLHFIRQEQKFDSFDELIAQINKDKKYAAQLLNE